MKEEDFKFNYLNYEETKEEYRNSPILTAELLYNVGWALHALNKRFDSGSVVLFSEVCLSKDMWDAVNYARLWPETNHPEADHLLQEALGNLGDAHYMIDELHHRAAGNIPTKTSTAYVSVINEVREALAHIKEAIVLIDNYIDTVLGGKHGDDPSSK
jgi:hypothetical protein